VTILLATILLAATHHLQPLRRYVEIALAWATAPFRRPDRYLERI
jgi:hypothetical protein